MLAGRLSDKMSGEPGYCVIQWPGFLLFIGGKMKEQIQLSDHFTYGRLIRFTLPSIGMMIFMSIGHYIISK